MSEIRRPGAGKIEDNRAKFVFSGSDGGEKRVRVLLSPDTANYLEGYWAVSDRVLLVKLKGQLMNINIMYTGIRGVPNILRQPAEAEYSAVWPNILPKPNRGSLFAE